MKNNPGKNYIAAIYDELYKDKPYLLEVERVLPFLKGHSVIDIGGGSGGHALVLEDKGFKVKVIDLSESMVMSAQRKGLDAELGDFDTFKSEKKFDSAISLFHVMNFSKDLTATFANIQELLVDGGVFVFDFWNNTLKKEGVQFISEGLLTRFAKKRWQGNRVYITFVYPLLFRKESYMLYCPDKADVLLQAQKAGFTVVDTKDTPLEYLIILQK